MATRRWPGCWRHWSTPRTAKSHTEKFITRFARIYTPIVCGIALALVLIPPLFFGGDWHEWIYRGLSALVVSCPCAIVISVPLSFFGGLSTCSREGILVKGSRSFGDPGSLRCGCV